MVIVIRKIREQMFYLVGSSFAAYGGSCAPGSAQLYLGELPLLYCMSQNVYCRTGFNCVVKRLHLMVVAYLKIVFSGTWLLFGEPTGAGAGNVLSRVKQATRPRMASQGVDVYSLNSVVHGHQLVDKRIWTLLCESSCS